MTGLLKDKLQSTKLIIAVGVFATATILLVGEYIPAQVWENTSQTVLFGYVLGNVAAQFAPKAPKASE